MYLNYFISSHIYFVCSELYLFKKLLHCLMYVHLNGNCEMKLVKRNVNESLSVTKLV